MAGKRGNPNIVEAGKATRLTPETAKAMPPRGPASWKTEIERVLAETDYVYYAKAEVVDSHNRPTGKTVRVRIPATTRRTLIIAQATKAAQGDTPAFRILAEMTGGLTDGKSSEAAHVEIIEHLKTGVLSASDVIEALGDEGSRLVIAAGKAPDTGSDTA